MLRNVFPNSVDVGFGGNGDLFAGLLLLAVYAANGPSLELFIVGGREATPVKGKGTVFFNLTAVHRAGATIGIIMYIVHGRLGSGNGVIKAEPSGINLYSIIIRSKSGSGNIDLLGLFIAVVYTILNIQHIFCAGCKLIPVICIHNASITILPLDSAKGDAGCVCSNIAYSRGCISHRGGNASDVDGIYLDNGNIERFLALMSSTVFA